MYDNKKQKIDLINEKLVTLLKNKISEEKNRLTRIKKNFILNNPSSLYKNNIVELNNLIEKLELLNPMNTLKRGFTLTYKDDKVIKSINNLNKRDRLKIKFYDGDVMVEVLDKEDYNG